MGVLNIITGTPGPHTPIMLAGALKVSKPMITAHLTSLMKKGYITKQPSLEDKRAYYILPTEKAYDLVQDAKEDLYRHLEQLEDGLGEGIALKDAFLIFLQLLIHSGRVRCRFSPGNH